MPLADIGCMIVSSICLDNGRRHWNALRPRGPFLFRSAGKGSKRGRFARHFGSGQMKPRSNPFGEPSQTRRFTSSQTHGKVRFCPTGKNSLTSHAEELLRVLPRPLDSAQRRIKMPVPQTIRNHAFCAFFFLDLIDKLAGDSQTMRIPFHSICRRPQNIRAISSGLSRAPFSNHL